MMSRDSMYIGDEHSRGLRLLRKVSWNNASALIRRYGCTEIPFRTIRLVWFDYVHHYAFIVANGVGCVRGESMIPEVVGFRIRAEHKHKVLRSIVYFWMTKTLSECRCVQKLSVDSKKNTVCLYAWMRASSNVYMCVTQLQQIWSSQGDSLLYHMSRTRGAQ